MIGTPMAGQILVGRASWSVVALTMKIVSRYLASTFISCKLYVSYTSVWQTPMTNLESSKCLSSGDYVNDICFTLDMAILLDLKVFVLSLAV